MNDHPSFQQLAAGITILAVISYIISVVLVLAVMNFSFSVEAFSGAMISTGSRGASLLRWAMIFRSSRQSLIELTKRKDRMSEYVRPIKALGEVVLRVRDIDVMQEFYEKVVGLELLERCENTMAFFRIAPDVGRSVSSVNCLRKAKA